MDFKKIQYEGVRPLIFCPYNIFRNFSEISGQLRYPAIVYEPLVRSRGLR